MLSFKPITTKDKSIITAFTYPSSYLNCDYAFANMCSWRFLYESVYAVSDNFLFIRFYIEEKGDQRPVYMFPLGEGDLRKAINRIEEDSEKAGFPLFILGMTPEAKSRLEELFPNNFVYMAERNYFDYIYLREDLQSLKGKKFQQKRNHINKFKKLYRYAYKPITQNNIHECIQLEKEWFNTNKTQNNERSISSEHRSITFALEHFDELGLLGGTILVENKIIAFSYGSPINHKAFGIHVEKADINYNGAFSVINQEFAANIPEQFLYINREEDLGLPGLRKSKLSYNPVIILEKNGAVKRR